jgi:hypothetical protein
MKGMTSEASRPAPVPVTLSVDEVTIVLGLLGVLCDEHTDDEVAALAGRTVARLRELLGAATA